MTEVLLATEPPLSRRYAPTADRPRHLAAPWPRQLLTFTLLAAGFAALLAFASIPTHLQADSCQIMLAVDRMSLGLGPTTIYPRVPEVDWGLITHWPLGYPLLIWAVKSLTGLTTVPAYQIINVAAFALALVGWAAWFRRCLPPSRTASLLAFTAGLLALVPSYLWQVNTDMILVALTPVLLMLIDRVVQAATAANRISPPGSWVAFALAGLLVGAVCWIRYSALFLTIGAGLYLLLSLLLRPGLGLKHLLFFLVGCILPPGLLLATNALWGPSAVDRPPGSLSCSWQWGWLSQWWHHYSQLPLFESHWRSLLLWSRLLPAGAALIILSRRSFRQATVSFLARPPVMLSACAVAGVFLLLIGFRVTADALYDPPSQQRYLLPVRPFYLLFFLGPLIALPSIALRRLICLPILACAVWLVQAGWIDSVRLWAAQRRPVTAYGREAVPFKNGADQLYAWLRTQNAPDLIVFSNFFDDIALEAHLPAQPLPAGVDELRARVRQISQARNSPRPKVLFVLEPDNMWRQYLPDLHQAMKRFDLQRLNSPNPVLARYVFVPRCLVRESS